VRSFAEGGPDRDAEWATGNSVGLIDAFRRWFRRGPEVSLGGLDPTTTKVIVGLGNPGPEYTDTRHNLGFRCVDLIAKRHGAGWQDKTGSLQALVAVVPNANGAMVLAKPQTFMNRSGTAVHHLLDFLKVPPAQALVTYDEMDLPFGVLRLRERGSAGTHNGMRSVVKTLETEDIPRLRIGIGQSSPGEATSHVLGEFVDEEKDAVDELVMRAADAAIDWAELGASVAMNRYNKM
jgi:PTH1 family peptidyl-tRNA hydrolase